MSTVSITKRTRMMVQDTGVPFAANIPVDGVSTVFDLPVESISETAYPPQVSLDGVIISNQSTPQYIIDYKHGVIAFNSPPGPAGAIIGVQGWYYFYFDDDEVAQAVTDGFDLHVQDQDPPRYIDPVLGQKGINQNEQYCVSILAAVELLWFLATDSSQLVDIHTPEGVTIPRSQRFEQVYRQVTALQEEYKTIAGALGVGLWRIEILFQRRVSYTTNRLVPLYREQEYNQPYTGFWPTSAPVGALVKIHGMWFDGATAVTFGGVPSLDFTVLSDKEIQAVVPVGATTGQIGVMTAYGLVLSTAQFVVGQPPPFILYGPQMVKPPIPPGK